MFRSKNIIFLILIVALGAVIRFYKIGDLAIFLADQASDSTAVLHILRGHPTLLGPISSVGGFYNGPIVFYLLLPFYWFFSADPISGTVFQTMLSLATIPLLYLLGKKLQNATVGLIAAFLFAISPMMVDYSRAAFIPYPAVFFSTLILYLLLAVIDRFSWWKTALIGLFIGFILQMHYLTVSLLLMTFFYPLFIEKKLVRLSYYLWLIVGIIAGFSPFLLFEIRHQFLNLRLIIGYLTTSKGTVKSITNIFQVWPTVTASLLTANNFWLGLISFFMTFLGAIVLTWKKSIKKQYAQVFFLLFGLTFLVGILYGGKMQSHYVVVFHTTLILLFSLVLCSFLKTNRMLIAAVCIFLMLMNSNKWNWQKTSHPVQDGLTIADFKKASAIIKNDQHKRVYNVAMHAQGDNRAMPLRYALEVINETPQPYTDYASSDTLYFITRKNEPITEQKMWEFTSFGPSQVQTKWEINRQYFLYRLEKI